jgi:4-hydroxybenzoate polyprenyltransferase
MRWLGSNAVIGIIWLLSILFVAWIELPSEVAYVVLVVTIVPLAVYLRLRRMGYWDHWD